MRNVPTLTGLLGLAIMAGLSPPRDLLGQHRAGQPAADHLFIYQGSYDSLGTVDEIAQLAARHDQVVVTHGFYLDGSAWVNGKCLDVDYKMMPQLLVKVREYNPGISIFAYVSATADHPNGCWPQPSVMMSECPDGSCADFRTWTDLWLNLEKGNGAIVIDGIFVDLVHPALIGAAVRDSVFSYVKSRGKLIMANALSDTLGLKFAAASPFLRPEDCLLVEGYYVLAGNANAQTEAMNRHLRGLQIHWAALASEAPGSALLCSSDNMSAAYDLFRRHGGSAFAYQSADLGTQTGTWVFCPHVWNPTSVPEMKVPAGSHDAVLDQIYPNPFNPTTTIRYRVARASVVTISVYTILGQIVRTLVNGFQDAGSRQVEFHAAGLPGGVYVCTLQAGAARESRLMTLVK